MRVLIIIPARGGSRGIPHKNLVQVGGLTLVARAVLTARQFVRRARLLDAMILVDTDSKEIAAEAEHWGATVPFLRPPELAADTTPTIDNVLFAIERLSSVTGMFDVVVLLQPTSPLRRLDDIESCWSQFDPKKSPSVVSLAQYGHPIEYALRLEEGGTVRWASGSPPQGTQRQDFEALTYPNGAVYIGTLDVWQGRSLIIPGVTRGVLMPLARSPQVDSADDLVIVRALAESQHRTELRDAPELHIGHRAIGAEHPPFVIAEVGINHEGQLAKALRMVDDAQAAGAECVKFQCHVIDDEMIPNSVVPGNASESIWDIMSRCALSEAEERQIKAFVESKGMIYLSTPFSRAGADRLDRMGVSAFKIGSGECNNYPLVRHIAGFGKPVILSTGMNDLDSIQPAVEILRGAAIPFALMHCTSMYPTPYDKVRLGALRELAVRFPDAVLGLSDHAIGIHMCLAAIPLGARLLEKHFTSDRSWPGPDIPISIEPAELRELLTGSRAVFEALGGHKTILPEEQPTIDFAYACVVATRHIAAGERLTSQNIWVKRPGSGEISAADFDTLLGKVAVREITKDAQLSSSDVA